MMAEAGGEEGETGLAPDEGGGLNFGNVVSILVLLAVAAGSAVWYRRHQRLLASRGRTLEQAAAEALAPDEVGGWLERYFPHVVYPPGSIPSCPVYGYALLGHVIEIISSRRYWHYTHQKIFQPLTMLASSCGGAHLPSIGPDPEAEARQKGELEQRAQRRHQQLQVQLTTLAQRYRASLCCLVCDRACRRQAMNDRIDKLEGQLQARTTHDPDDPVGRQVSITGKALDNSLYFSTFTGKQALEDEQAEQEVRRAKLEEERVRDAALVAQMESDHMKSLQVPLGRTMHTCTPLTYVEVLRASCCRRS
jgi:hypothetical protein